MAADNPKPRTKCTECVESTPCNYIICASVLSQNIKTYLLKNWTGRPVCLRFATDADLELLQNFQKTQCNKIAKSRGDFSTEVYAIFRILQTIFNNPIISIGDNFYSQHLNNALKYAQKIRVLECLH